MDSNYTHYSEKVRISHLRVANDNLKFPLVASGDVETSSRSVHNFPQRKKKLTSTMFCSVSYEQASLIPLVK